VVTVGVFPAVVSGGVPGVVPAVVVAVVVVVLEPHPATVGRSMAINTSKQRIFFM